MSVEKKSKKSKSVKSKKNDECVQWFYKKKDIPNFDNVKYIIAADYGFDGKKQYCICDNVKEIEHLIEDTKLEDRNYYEVIRGDKPQKIRFDIDASIKKDEKDMKGLTPLLIDDIKSMFLNILKEAIIHTFLIQYQIEFDKKDICIDDSSTKTKVSFHVMIQKYHVINAKENKLFYDQVIENIRRDDFKSIIDKAIYSNFQCFRLRGCCKMKKNNIKKPITNHSFSESLSSCVDNTILLPLQEPKELVTIINEDQDEDESKDLLTIIDEKKYDPKELVKLINQCVTSSNHSLCDEKQTTKIKYVNWRCLLFAWKNLVSSIKGYDNEGRNIYIRYICPLYKHYESKKEAIEKAWESVDGNHKDGYTVASLIRWAKEHSSFKVLFPELCIKQVKWEKLNIKGDYTEYKDTYFPRMIPKRKVFVGISKLGGGKTTSIINYIKEDDKKNILFLSPRVSFAQSIQAELKLKGLEFSSYKGKKEGIQDKRLIIQVESLWKIKRREEEKDMKYDILIIDECESVLTQMLSQDTHKKRMLENHQALLRLINDATNIIMTDAFVSNKTINFLNILGLEYEVHNHMAPPVKRTCCEIPYSSKKENLLEYMLDDLKAGKKIYFICSSQTKLIKFQKVINDKLPNIKIKEYHSGCDNTLENIKQEWLEIDIIMCTSSITVGCNFDIPNIFDRIYIYVNAPSQNLIRDIFQSHMRVRHIKDNHLVYCIDHNPRTLGKHHLPCNRNLLWKDLKNLEKYLITNNSRGFIDTENCFRYLYIDNKLERNLSIKKIINIFDLYLSKCGYTKVNIEDVSDYTLELSKCDIVSYEDIKDITSETATELKRNYEQGDRNKESMLQIEKFFFNIRLIWSDNIPIEKRSKLWNIYNIHGGKLKFENIAHERCVDDNKLSSKEYKEKFDKRIDIFYNLFPEKLFYIKDLCKKLKIKSTYSSKIIKIDKKVILKVGISLFEEAKLIKTLFGLKVKEVKKTRDATENINCILKSWGFSNLTSETRNGKTGIYDIKESEEVSQFIKPKTHTIFNNCLN